MHHPEQGVATRPDDSRPRQRERLALLIVILAALGLRLGQLAFRPLWWDEGWSLYFAKTDVSSLLQLTAVDIHPPLYYLILKLWIGIVGPSPIAVRLFSVLVGTAAVPLLYATGRRLWGGTAGLVAALLLAVSPLHIYYSQEVRMYGLVTLLGLAVLFFALRWEPGGQRRGNWAGYVLAATAALYTQYYAAFLLLALNLVVPIRWLFMRSRSRRDGNSGSWGKDLLWWSAQGAVALLYLPWLWYAGGKLRTYVSFKISVEQDPSLDLLTYLGRHLSAFNWGHAEGLLADCWWLGMLPIAVLALALVLSRWQRMRKGEEPGQRIAGMGSSGLCLLILGLMLACGFVVNLALPFNPPRSERLLLLALPTYLLLVTGALLALWQRRALVLLPGGLLLAAGFLSLGFFYTTPRYADDDYRPLASQIQAMALPTDAIICIHPWQVGYLQSYIVDDKARPGLVLSPRQVIPHERQLWADDPGLMAADLEALLSEHGRLWLLDHRTMGRVLESEVESYLAEHAYPVRSDWFGENTVLSLFAPGRPESQLVTAQFGEWLMLEDAALNRDSLQAGWGIVTAQLSWRLLQRPDERYHVGLRLVDGTGRVWSQRDSPPGGGLHHFFEWPVDETRLDRHGLLAPAGMPPGEYRVTMRIYRSQDAAVVPVSFDGGSGGEVTLGKVRIIRPHSPPPVEALAIEEEIRAEFGDLLRLLGAELESGSSLRPGEAVEIGLFWQALGDPGQDFLPRLQLLDATSASLAEVTEKPVAGTYPTAWWRAGDLVRDPHALPIPAQVPPGRYRLALSLIRAADGKPIENRQGQILVDLVEVEVVSREHRYVPTVPDHVQEAQFGTAVELAGFDMREVVRAPGSPLEVTLHWHVLETPDKGYHSFVHLIDTGGQIVAQHDGPPGEGEAPALGWLPGEYLIDSHLLGLPFTLPDGEYRLGVGLYDPSTGHRLGERLLLNAQVPVRANEGCQCR
jgi:4-amino-4-deoxy-L-arabinose transferase-like glycosyltransferase